MSRTSLFQEPARTPEEIEASKPLDIPPEQVLEVDEAEWYARIYRRNAPQLTVRAVLMGTVLGFFLSFTNVYIGLKTGWFLGVNLTACILSYAIWQGAKRRGLVSGDMSILENTCAVSTASSAGYATGNQLISAIPAMLILSVSPSSPGGKQLPYLIVGAWVFCLGALGVTLAIPMKRSMINRDKLKFPSGTAAAVTLQGLYSRGAEAIQKARVLFITAGISALVPLLKELEIVKGNEGREALLPGQSNVFDWLGRLFPNAHMFHAGPDKLHKNGAPFNLSDYQVKLDHGVALVFAGMIIGIRVAAWMVVGGLILVIFIAPPALDWQWVNAKGDYIGAATKPGSAWKEIGIWTGAPLLVASGLVAFAAQWRTIVRAIEGALPGKKKGEDGKTAYRGPSAGSDEIDPDTVEVPGKWFAIGTVTSGIAVVLLATLYFEIPPHLGVLAVLMTFVLALVACRATGETDITPGGAMGKIMQLTYGVLVPQSSTANLMTASITSGSSLASADLLNDLKTGYLLGANPRRQYIAQALGIFTGAVATTLCYYVLVPDASVLLGSETRPPAFPAPAAQQWKAVAEVFKYGFANLHPMSQKAIVFGLVAGTILAVLEAFVPKKHKKWIPSPTGIGLGLTLPFFYPLAIFLGAVFAEVAQRVNRAWAERYVVTIAAGGIAGESIVGVIVQALNNFVLH